MQNLLVKKVTIKVNEMGNESLVIAGHCIEPGERKIVHLPLPELYDCSPILMPVHIIRGKKRGPVLLVTAAIHGDELNGVEIIRRLLKQKSLSKLKGTLIAIPIVNIYGFLYQSRYLMDRRDLNRSFPGSVTGSIAARLAHMLLNDVVIHATHVIDLHSGSAARTNLPQIRSNLDNAANIDFAKSFNAPVILDLLEPEGSFRHALKASNIPFLLYEAGEALRFDEYSIRIGLRGILSVMRSLNMLPKLKKEPTQHSSIAYHSNWIRAEHSGTIVFDKKLGSKVNASEVIARIANPLTGKEYEVSAKKTGIVIGKSNLPLTHEGKALFHIAYHDKPQLIADRVAQLEELLSIQ
jgi:hypothetical protein